MYDLYLKADQRHLGAIADDEMQFLRDNLEEESLTDDDYTINRLTLAYLRENGLSAHLAGVLDQALGERDEVEITYRAREGAAPLTDE